jgi:hypothetical protein
LSVERPQVDLVDVGRHPQPVEPGSRRRSEGGLVGAERRDQREPLVAARQHQVSEQVQGDGISPVEVLHHDVERRTLGHLGQEFADGEEEVLLHDLCFVRDRLRLSWQQSVDHAGKIRPQVAEGGV